MKFSGEHFDEVLSNGAAYLLETRKPHLLLVHLIDLDHDQHLHGPENDPALRSLEKIDAAVGKLRKATEAAGVAAQTRWIIVSDHGFFPVEKALPTDAILSSFRLAAPDNEPSIWRAGTMIAGGSVAFFSKKIQPTSTRRSSSPEAWATSGLSS